MITISLNNTTRAKLIDAVLGQLSDGYWEDSPAMNKYWKYANISGTDLIINNDDWSSGFKGKSEEWIKNWFAGKLKAVAQYEVGNNKAGWNRDNMQLSEYLGGWRGEVTISECYECYDFLKGRSGHKYAFQKSEDSSDKDQFIKIIKNTLKDSLDVLYFKETASIVNWMTSVVDYFTSHYDNITTNGFDLDYITDLEFENNDDIDKYIDWPNPTDMWTIFDYWIAKGWLLIGNENNSDKILPENSFLYEYSKDFDVPSMPILFKKIYINIIRKEIFKNLIDFYAKK